MTSYSIAWVTGDLDDDEALGARIETFLAGAARNLLDETRVEGEDDDPDASETTYAEAEWWHSPRAGWELGAFDPESREKLRARGEAFVRANRADLGLIVAEIVNRGEQMWGTDPGYAWYRAGMLWVYAANGAGIGFFDYGYRGIAIQAADRLQEAAHYGLDGHLCGITAWCYDPDHPDVDAHVEEI